MDNIISPGFYQNKMTLEAEKPEIIRIIGIDPTNPSYWLTQFNEKIPEYHLTSNYVRLDYHMNQEAAKSKLQTQNKLLSDFTPIKIDEIQPSVEKKKSVHNKKVEKPVSFHTGDEPKPSGTTIITEKIDTNLVRSDEVKIHVEPIKEESKYSLFFQKCQCTPYHKEISVSFMIGYDLNKLVQTIEILGLDVNDCVDDLFETIDEDEIISSFKESLRTIIKGWSLKKEIPEELKVVIKEEPKIEVIPEKKVEDEELIQGINIIDLYLNN